MNIRHILSLSAVASTAIAMQAKTYELTAPSSWEPIRSKHLKMGGTSPDGGSIEVNNFYVIRDGKPVVPVCGEFHYSRYPADQWEQGYPSA